MSTQRDTFFDKLIEAQKNEAAVEFTELELIRKERIEFIFEIRTQNPYMTDAQIFSRLRTKYKSISYQMMMADVMLVERVIAHTISPEADWQRTFSLYFVLETLKEAMQIARAKDQAFNLAYSAGIYAKYLKLDKNEEQSIDYSKIVPFIPEVTSDPSVLGLKPIKNKGVLLQKFKQLFDEMEQSNKMEIPVISQKQEVDEYED